MLSKPKNFLIGLLTLIMFYQGYKMYKNKEYYKEVCKEIPKVITDWCTDNSPKINSNELYMDLQVHFKKPECYPNGIESIIKAAMKKVDVITIMTHGKGSEEELNFEGFKENAKKYISRNMGNVVEIKRDNDALYVIKGQEIRTKQKREVLALGCDYYFEHKQDIQKTINKINKEGISIIAHPFTIPAPFIVFRLANKREEKQLEEICEKENGPDAIEQFNSQNTLYMFPSNVKARLFVKKYDIPGTAASDDHYSLNQIGLAGIIVSKDKIDTSNGKVFVSSLKRVIRNKEFRIHIEYCGPISFTKSMILPFRYLKSKH